MPSFRAAQAFVRRFLAYRTQFHLFNYIISKLFKDLGERIPCNMNISVSFV
ncbi:MAG: hypothetical protein QMD07_08695 [Thermodesulfovibrionales bacterium]|nr:hypothetical protein [Thermodesulfovibrionales bacterium]